MADKELTSSESDYSDSTSDSNSDDDASATALTVIRDMLRLFKMKSIRPSIDMLSKENRNWIKNFKKNEHLREKALKIANRKKALRQRALDKLTDEEKDALGIR